MTDFPKRIQRKRTKGWRLPENTKCVTRPGKFGNPFETAEEFRKVLQALLSGPGEYRLACNIQQYSAMAYIAANLEELRGFNLACFCGPDKACHADVLIEFANRERV